MGLNSVQQILAAYTCVAGPRVGSVDLLMEAGV